MGRRRQMINKRNESKKVLNLFEQYYNPSTKRWVKIMALTGEMVETKETSGAYEGLPKRRVS